MKNYKFIFDYLWRRKGMSLLIFILALVGTLFYGVGIGLFVPLLETLQAGTNPEYSSWLLKKINYLYSILHITPTFSVLLSSMFIMISLKIFLTVIHNYLGNKLCVDCTKWLRVESIRSLLEVGVSYYHKKKIGSLINTIVREAREGAQSVYLFICLIVQIFTLIMYIIMMSLLSWKMMMLMLGIFAVVSLLIQFMIGKVQRLSKRGLEKRNLIASKLLELFSGIKIVKAYLQEKNEIGKVGNILEEARSIQLSKKFNATLVVAISEFTMALSLVGIIFLSVQIFELNFAVLITFLFILSRLAPDVTKFNAYRTNLAETIVPLEKTSDLISRDNKPYIINGEKTIDSFHDGISFKEVYFSYKGKEVVALKDVSFEIKNGEVVALVGASGGGKSTLIELLFRFYDPTRGIITVDGINLKDLAIESWRSKIGLVLQDNFLFHDTIKNNIIYGKTDASEDEIVKAAKEAYIHEYIMDLPREYNTIVGDRGVLLSGGQRQRIALARALIKKPEILILDEAMSALDVQSEHHIQNAIEKIRGDCTVIIVAHRFSTLEKANKIVVIEKGEIVEIGTQSELLANKEHYAEYYNLQYKVKTPNEGRAENKDT